MRHYLLGSTRLSRLPIAFDGMAIAPPASVNMGMIAALIDAAKSAGAVGAQSTDKDLSARNTSSALMLPYWDLSDDIISGYKTIKARGTKYLPKFPDEEQTDYDGRLLMSEMTNVFRDICESLASKPFEEEIQLVIEKDKALPKEIEEFIEDVDGAGSNITSFGGGCFFQGIVSAIDWIYVDYPTTDPTQIRTQADATANNIRPYWSRVLGRNVLEVVSQMIGGKETRVYMRILEPGTPNHIRVFDRNPITNAVQWALFEEKIDNGKKTFIMVGSGDITIGVIPLEPFITGRRDGRSWKFDPALNDAADLQIELYIQESGLKFAKTMTAYPMLAANGMNPQKGPDGQPLRLAVGPSRVLYGQRDGHSGNFGSWEYVSPDAACLEFLKKDIKETMDQLRELGRQPLTAQSGNLTVITTAYAAGKSKSSVGAWALRLKDTLENALKMTCMWLNIAPDTYDPKVRVYDEFDDFQNDQAADLTALKDMRAARDLSQRTFWREMQRRTVLSDEFDADEEEQALLDEVPDANANVIDDGTGNHPNGAPKYDGNGVPLDPKGTPLPPGKDHPPPPLPAAKAKKKPLKKIRRNSAPTPKA